MARRDLSKLKKQLDKQKKLFGGGIESPRAIEVAYSRKLNGLVNDLIAMTATELTPTIQKQEKFFVKDADPATVLTETLNIMRKKGDAMAQLHFKYADTMTRATDKYNRKVFVKQINEVAGVNIGDILNDNKTDVALRRSLKENIDLIKTIPEEHFDRIEKALLQGIDGGKDFFSIKKDLHEIGGISKRRAKVIARDQVSKLNSKLDRIRQQDIGVEEYTWDTSNDERVRDTHEANGGHVFRWDKPPPETGHPGEDVLCRCTASPNLENLLKTLTK